ncbi:inositol 1,4,5-trisphosphate receptor-interacting protein-like 1 [Porphyrio hochstetteri]
MAVSTFFTIFVRTMIQQVQLVGEEMDEATLERMKQREEFLSKEMARLLQERMLRSAEQSYFARGFSLVKQWQFCVLLFLLFRLCKWLWKRIHQQVNKWRKAGKGKTEEKCSIALDVGRISAERVLRPPEPLNKLDELMSELLRLSRALTRNSFMPRLKSPIRVDKAFVASSPYAHDTCCLLVPLKPPRGHAFHLELSSAEERPAKDSLLRVELVCTCTMEHLVGDMLCFLHTPKEQLRKHQGPSLLSTLCTGPYLDMEKITLWFHILVEAVWVFLPQSRHCSLIALPSRRSCRFCLTTNSNHSHLIEMILGVQHSDSDTFLSIE